MGRLTGRSRTVSRITGSTAVMALLTACMVSHGEAGVRTPSRAGEATSWHQGVNINNSGLVIG